MSASLLAAGLALVLTATRYEERFVAPMVALVLGNRLGTRLPA